MDPNILVSPCDAIVGASGSVNDGQVLQVKGSLYALDDLLGDAEHAATFRNGCYVTLRLTSSMYHRFHAPYDCDVSEVSHFPGDVWNVNPITLKRVDRLFCKNERAVIRTRLTVTGHAVTLVPVAAILVAIPGHRPPLRSTGTADISVQRVAAERRGDGMVRAWLDHHRAGARRFSLLRHGDRGHDDQRRATIAAAAGMIAR
jgi:Phosphatidylserine decarboxylase